MSPSFVPLSFLLLSSQLVLVAGGETRNVALRRDTEFCSSKKLSQVLVDGNLDPKFPERVTGKCGNENPYITINFHGEHHVHFVLVFEGDPFPGEQSRGELDRFSVYHIFRQMMSPCNRYPGLSLGPGLPMRVNCWNSETASRMIVLLSSRPHGMNIAEVETHSLVSTGAAYIWVSRGCFSMFNHRTASRFVSREVCRAKCYAGNFTFSAITANQTCFCGYNYDLSNELPDYKCSFKCEPGGTYSCGGNGSFSIYLVNVILPKYYGCVLYRFKRRGRSYLKDVSMTVVKCLHFCRDDIWALLQNGTGCECKDDGNPGFATPTPENDCSVPCGGDAKTFCGGSISASAYRTCQFTNDTISTCSLMFRCSGQWNHHGECSTECQYGYAGKHCLSKDIALSRREKRQRLFMGVVVSVPILLAILGITYWRVHSKKTRSSYIEEWIKLSKRFTKRYSDS